MIPSADGGGGHGSIPNHTHTTPHPHHTVPPAASASTTAITRLLVTLVGASLIALGTIAWSSKADKADVDALRHDLRRVLDLLCIDRPAVPQCSTAFSPR